MSSTTMKSRALIGCQLRTYQMVHKHLKKHKVSVLAYRLSHNQIKKPLFRAIPNLVDKHVVEYNDNIKYNQGLEEKYNQLVNLAEAGGGEKGIERHTKHNKKVLASDRLKMLFDNKDEVLELSKLSGLGMPYGNIARAGLIAAIGKIQGVYCLVLANDATVKGGTVYPIGVKKQLRYQEVAQVNFLPTVYVMDSGGAFLPLQADIFTQGGRTFYNEAILNSLGVPQLAVVCGSCTAGAAYVPTMSQEALIVHKIGTIFLGGPPLVYAALGEVVSPEDLGGATMHSSISGCTDFFSGTEEEAFDTSRDVVATFNIHPPEPPVDYDEPLYDPKELGGIIPHQNQHAMNMYQVIARIVDGSRFHEFKKLYGTTIVTGFAYLKGYLIGILGNNGAMTEQAALKGSHFVQMCSQRNIPILFLQNATPDSSLIKEVAPEGSWDTVGQTLRGHGQLMASVACASNVPKFTVIVGNSYGANNFMMGGRAFDSRFVFSWPNAKICMVDPQEAQHYITHQSSQEDDSQTSITAEELSAQLEAQSSAFYATANIWDDGIILPRHTRQVIGQCLEIVNQAKGVQSQSTEFGVVRM